MHEYRARILEEMCILWREVPSEPVATYVRHSGGLETPHVYLKGRVIVVSGDDPRVVDVLDTLLAPSTSG